MTYNNFVKLILMCQFDFLIADVTLCHVNDTSFCKGLVVKLVISLTLLNSKMPIFSLDPSVLEVGGLVVVWKFFR